MSTLPITPPIIDNPRGLPAHAHCLPSTLALAHTLNAVYAAAAANLSADVLAGPASSLTPEQYTVLTTHGPTIISTVLASPPSPEILTLAAGTLNEDNLPRKLLLAAIRFIRFAHRKDALEYYARVAEPLSLLTAFVGGTAPSQVARVLAQSNIVVRPPTRANRPKVVDLQGPNYVLCETPPRPSPKKTPTS